MKGVMDLEKKKYFQCGWKFQTGLQEGRFCFLCLRMVGWSRGSGGFHNMMEWAGDMALPLPSLYYASFPCLSLCCLHLKILSFFLFLFSSLSLMLPYRASYCWFIIFIYFLSLLPLKLSVSFPPQPQFLPSYSIK